jgi:hypothetical protein
VKPRLCWGKAKQLTKPAVISAYPSYTYYRWRKVYGGMKVDQAKRLKDLEKENARLKKLVADLSLDNAILKDVAYGNF